MIKYIPTQQSPHYSDYDIFPIHDTLSTILSRPGQMKTVSRYQGTWRRGDLSSGYVMAAESDVLTSLRSSSARSREGPGYIHVHPE